MILNDDENPISLGSRGIQLVQAECTAARGADGYDVCFTGDAEPAVQARPHQMQGKQGVKPSPTDRLPTPESRAAFRARWKTAQGAAASMVTAAENGDLMGLGIAADDLEQSLAELWDLRHGRDVDWQTILNHAQGMMRLFFQEKRAERLTADQCKMIVRLVQDYLGPATKTIDDLNEVLRLIDDAGFDPYAAISADPLDARAE